MENNIRAINKKKKRDDNHENIPSGRCHYCQRRWRYDDEEGEEMTTQTDRWVVELIFACWFNFISNLNVIVTHFTSNVSVHDKSRDSKMMKTSIKHVSGSSCSFLRCFQPSLSLIISKSFQLRCFWETRSRSLLSHY